MELQFEHNNPVIKPSVAQELKKRLFATYNYDTRYWMVALSCIWLLVIVGSMLIALGLPTGHGTVVDLMLFISGGCVASAISANLLAALLALTGLPAPRLFIGAVLSAGAGIFTMFYIDNNTWEVALVIACVSTIICSLAGISLASAVTRGHSFLRRCLGTLIPALLCVLILVLTVNSNYTSSTTNHNSTVNSTESTVEGIMPPIDGLSPASPGHFSYHTFTYGSGHDLHRPDFGANARLMSASVDATKIIPKWSNSKTKYLGFDPSNFPLNGTVWMPSGNGPFPLVLIVHGNHLMEDNSDTGYAYLGQLLASRGFITISVDENFLNYSAWNGIPTNDLKARAWLILKHLQQIRIFASNPSTPLYGRVDFDSIGLIGHSRGGQAVAMAADPLRWFERGDGLENIDLFHIRGVVALAPTDTTVDNNQARLSNIDYLSLQGAQDGDVNDFYGDRQYNRASMIDVDHFKSTLYIGGANHSQFNTGWGLYDQSFPSGILLNQSQIISGSNQRQIAKVYVSAFMETALYHLEQYKLLFQDYRKGLPWLPQTSYYNQYQDGSFYALASIQGNQMTGTYENRGTIKASHVNVTVQDIRDRERNSKGKQVAVLYWPKPNITSQSASYSLLFPSTASSGSFTESHSRSTGLTFSLASLNYELSKRPSNTPDMYIELQSTNGAVAKLPLTTFMPITPLPTSTFTLNPWLEEELKGGKYKNPTENVLQTYRLNFAAFEQQNPQFRGSKLTRITWMLGQAPGKIMLADIGLYH